MKKILFLIFAIICLSCSSDESSNPKLSTYNPPSWIQGKWGIKANGTTILNDNAFYSFSNDNVCQILQNAGTTLCWKESIEQSSSVLSGNDISTATTYTANFISGGNTTLSISFKKISATKIIWVGTSNGDIELEKLN